MRAAWKLTGQSGAWSRVTFPLLGWLSVMLLLSVGISMVSFKAGMAGFIIGSALSLTLLLPVFCLLVVSRFMRLYTLKAG